MEKTGLTDDSLMPFGKHKTEKMINVPADYLIWCDENCSQGVREKFPEVFEYIKDNMDALIKEAG